MSNQPVNASEAFVLEICQRSFLSLWCYNNPRGKGGKELCDILVVCDPHVILVSVKEVALKRESGGSDHKKWTRKAVDASIKQIYGAERWLASASQVIRSDGTPGLDLPPLSTRKVHRIAVAFGSRGETPIPFVRRSRERQIHVMTENGFREILTELDTITDLVAYLAELDRLSRECGILAQGESDLLAWYIANERSFPTGPTFMIVGEGIWGSLQERPEFKRRKKADRDSYFWDRLIELFIERYSGTQPEVALGPKPSLTDLEYVVRVMARETRFNRRLLGRSVRTFLEKAKAGELRSRVLDAQNGALYVLVYFGANEDPESHGCEVASRCIVARHDIGHGENVIGIGIGAQIPGVGSASTFFYINCEEWSVAQDEIASDLKAESGYFAKAYRQDLYEDEFPAP